MTKLLARLLASFLGPMALLAMPAFLAFNDGDGGGDDDGQDDGDGDGDGTGDDDKGGGGSDDDDDDDGQGDDEGDLATKLAEERRKRKAAERRARAAERRASKTKSGSRKDGDTDDDDAAAERARQEERQRSNRRVVRAEVKALAGTRFADPSDAAEFLAADFDEFLDEDGDVDEDAIAEALDDLAERKPYLLAKKGAKRDPGQGKRGGKPSAKDIGRDEARKRFGDPAGSK